MGSREVNTISFRGYGFGISVGYPMGWDKRGISHPFVADKIKLTGIYLDY